MNKTVFCHKKQTSELNNLEKLRNWLYVEIEKYRDINRMTEINLKNWKNYEVCSSYHKFSFFDVNVGRLFYSKYENVISMILIKN